MKTEIAEAIDRLTSLIDEQSKIWTGSAAVAEGNAATTAVLMESMRTHTEALRHACELIRALTRRIEKLEAGASVEDLALSVSRLLYADGAGGPGRAAVLRPIWALTQERSAMQQTQPTTTRDPNDGQAGGQQPGQQEKQQNQDPDRPDPIKAPAPAVHEKPDGEGSEA